MKWSIDAVQGAIFALILSLSASAIVMYGEVQTMKETKADKTEVLELKNDVGKQIALNTQAINNLDTTLGRLIQGIEEWRKQGGHYDR